MKKQFIAKLLVLAMLLAMVPASVLAVSAGTNAGSIGDFINDGKAFTLNVSGGGSVTAETGVAKDLTVSASVKAENEDVSGYYSFAYAWEDGDGNVINNDKNTYTFKQNYSGPATIKCTVSVTPKTSDTTLKIPTPPAKTVTWSITVYQGADFTVSGSVSNDTEDYYLGEITDKYGDSIIDQIDAELAKKVGSKNYDDYDATFRVTDGTDGKGRLAPTTKKYDLDEAADSVYFYLTSVLTSSDLSSKGQSTFEFLADVTPNYSKSARTYTVAISITVDDDASVSSGDISYTAAIGDDVNFDIDDFEDFYHSKSNSGTLKYVSFDTVSGGTLYCSDGRVGTKDCYVNPTSSRQASLDGVYFTPTGTTAKQAKTVKIGFTAYGSKSSRSGTVVITYLNGEAADITYSLNANGSVSLNPSDFTAAYKEVTKKTAPTGMTIVFQGVPSNGTLTYLDSSKKTAKEVTLKSSNIKSYNFTTRTSGSYRLGDVTYKGSSSKSDTINYIAYSGSTALFTGKVVFNGKKEVPTNLTVTFTSTSSAGVNFTSSAFNAANADVMKSASYIHFGMPAHGFLTYGGATATAVNIPIASLGGVLYKPTAGFNNSTDTVAFIVYDVSGNNIGSGKVSIVVSGNATAANTTPSNGATSVDQFTDVPSNAWYRTELADLVSKGIISGRDKNTFDPSGKVTNGEALKMILIAAGYPAQAQGSGSDWAINYRTLAENNNLISKGVALNAEMSRDAVAELAAKALGLSPVTSGKSPFVDNTNGYAIALYNAGIIQGDLTTGQRMFLGTQSLERAQICKIIYAMNAYAATRYSSNKPDGI